MLARFFTYVVLSSSVLLTSACGGDAFTTTGGDGDGDDAGDGDGDGSGGTGSGGSSTGGSSTGGSSTGGSSTGGTSSLERDCFSTFDCQLVDNTCCGTCEMKTLGDVMAITRGQDEQLGQELCGETPVPCLGCEAPPNPNLFAACSEGTCEAYDLRRHEDSACITNDDCVLAPAACCPCGAGNGPGEFVTVNRTAETFQESQCDTTPLCDDCVWEPPPGIVPVCMGGSCTLPPMSAPPAGE